MNNTFYIAKSPDDIQHYGVLGMKWGVRRYENKDGTLTMAGRNRYRVEDGKYAKIGQKRLNQTRQLYEHAKANRKNDENSRLLYKTTKKQLRHDKIRLKIDKAADKGQELRSKGKTIKGAVAAIVGAAALTAIGTRFIKSGIKTYRMGAGMSSSGKKYIAAMLGAGSATLIGGNIIGDKAKKNLKSMIVYDAYKKNPNRYVKRSDLLKKERQKMFGTSKK